MLGVVTRLTLSLVDGYNVRQRVYGEWPPVAPTDTDTGAGTGGGLERLLASVPASLGHFFLSLQFFRILSRPCERQNERTAMLACSCTCTRTREGARAFAQKTDEMVQLSRFITWHGPPPLQRHLLLLLLAVLVKGIRRLHIRLKDLTLVVGAVSHRRS